MCTCLNLEHKVSVLSCFSAICMSHFWYIFLIPRGKKVTREGVSAHSLLLTASARFVCVCVCKPQSILAPRAMSPDISCPTHQGPITLWLSPGGWCKTRQGAWPKVQHRLRLSHEYIHTRIGYGELRFHCSLDEFFLRWHTYCPECEEGLTPQPGAAPSSTKDLIVWR